VVGLPFPNPTDLVLQEKKDYMDREMKRGGSTGPSPGQVYYHNLCMRQVNQSIGRSIRHINDFAVTLLVDVRYERQDVVAGLPKWIRERLKQGKTGVGSVFNEAFKSIREFFSYHKNRESSA
jgi:chromosome transmission fidelity protein 1